MESKDDHEHIDRVLLELTDGKPFVFMIESFSRPRVGVFEFVRDRIKEEFGLACIRAKEVNCSGHDLLAKIHFLIHHAVVVVAEVTDPQTGHPSPNVYYEVGYAVGVSKRPLLLVESGSKVPTDVSGLEFIEYQWPGPAGRRDLSRKISSNLRFRISSNRPMLLDMLQPQRQGSASSLIVTSPKRVQQGEEYIASVQTGEAPTIRTFGDRLGILGLIRAFGSILDEAGVVDLVSTRHPADELLRHDSNLYFIGSPKVNPPAGDLLRRLQEKLSPRWSFCPAHDADGNAAGEEKDIQFVLCREERDGIERLAGKSEKRAHVAGEIWTEDYGLIVRGPHPLSKSKRIVMLMAGAHSLGTGAACLAATRAPLIRKIREKLRAASGKDILADSDRHFWVLVKGCVKRPDYLLNEDGVGIEGAELFH